MTCDLCGNDGPLRRLRGCWACVPCAELLDRRCAVWASLKAWERYLEKLRQIAQFPDPPREEIPPLCLRASVVDPGGRD